MAARASLQRPSDQQILTPAELFTYCQEEIKNIKFAFSTNADHEAEAELLKERHEMAITISGTQKLHYFEPCSLDSLIVKAFSSDTVIHNKKVANLDATMPEKDIPHM